MLVRFSERSWEWSPGTVAALALAGVQIALALAGMAHPTLLTLPFLLLLAALTIADAVLIAYASLPVEAKVMAVAAIGLALTGAAMIHGTVRPAAVTIPALASPDVMAGPGAIPPVSRTAGLTIAPGDDAVAAGFGTDVTRLVAEAGGDVVDPPEIAATISVDTDALGTAYRLVWSIRRGADRRWCGQSMVRHASREAAARAVAALIVAARSIPATEGLRCD
ncbi:hypothetical protein ASG37_01415 [Sphingomonas sp. Leaf407]|uniref:hypothetical protein n=1 Tax=unclassified Sphingomonas TaxID=196159 RepID=UPI00070225E3|nr:MULTISPECIES: hypothetical protein [unclassified Sphingomonas]KQN40490.1 hypothetical protein ASE97_01440 [Sphingomonas sp. Leaf42]KQT29844.1 hypothetical protein ASG37_01415 [Sphingomonas sp. Leaf407]